MARFNRQPFEIHRERGGVDHEAVEAHEEELVEPDVDVLEVILEGGGDLGLQEVIPLRPGLGEQAHPGAPGGGGGDGDRRA